MSTLVRSFIVVAALLGSVSTASATFYGYNGYNSGHGHDYRYGSGKRWVKVNGHWYKQDVRAFFEQLKRNSGN